VSVHRPEQVIWPTGQTQVPAAHTWSPRHEVPQPPQWEALERRSMQAPPQAVRPAEHEVVHSPLSHRGADAAHAAPHAPQFAGSVAGSTHPALQRRLPGEHVHVPELHTSLAPQRFSHAPQ
jgi:hypothetical protein